jgi:hypothetical protein
MRRLAAPRVSVERALLTIYWVLSGYALRASRAFVTLVAVLALGGFMLDEFGDAQELPGDYLDATLLLAQVALALTRPPDGLNDVGIVIVIVARLACPALLALAVLALRSRVKR